MQAVGSLQTNALVLVHCHQCAPDKPRLVPRTPKKWPGLETLLIHGSFCPQRSGASRDHWLRLKNHPPRRAAFAELFIRGEESPGRPKTRIAEGYSAKTFQAGIHDPAANAQHETVNRPDLPQLLNELLVLLGCRHMPIQELFIVPAPPPPYPASARDCPSLPPKSIPAPN